MKTNEIQIGDWVYSTFSKLPCKVTYQKLHESGYASVETTNVVGVKDIASLSPIPLTPEILEKNGLEKEVHRYGIYDDYYDFEMYEYNDGTWLVSYHCCEMQLPDEQLLIYYVHQLQHFMHHCGIEKEIEL